MPKNMKYDATTKKAGAPKKKMKSNQDGGSMTAKDPAAAGKEMIANQEGAAKYKKGPAMYKKGPAQKKPDANKNGVPDYAEDGVGASRMGYSQKFGPGRMNGYDAGAKKVMDVMTYGAGKYMEGPAQTKDVKSGERMILTTGITEKNPKGYQISVNKNAGYAELAKQLGGNTLPNSFRSVVFTKDTDPSAVDISEEESKRRRKAYKESSQKTDVKSGSSMRKSTYLPRQ
jgi:hypothetical protein